MGTTRLSSSQPGCKVCSNTNIDSARRPKLSAETFITDHHSLSGFLFTDALSHEALCRYILTPISIFPLENHPSPLSIASESPPLDKSLSAVGVNVLERQMKSTSISCQCSVPTQCIQGTDRVTKKQLKLSYFQRYRSSDFHE